jgi:hypothetical protein
MENSNLLPVDTFIDSGTIGHGKEANIISRRIFDILVVNNKNLNYNLQTVNICSGFLNSACDKSLMNLHFDFIFPKQRLQGHRIHRFVLTHCHRLLLCIRAIYLAAFHVGHPGWPCSAIIRRDEPKSIICSNRYFRGYGDAA